MLLLGGMVLSGSLLIGRALLAGGSSCLIGGSSLLLGDDALGLVVMGGMVLIGSLLRSSWLLLLLAETSLLIDLGSLLIGDLPLNCLSCLLALPLPLGSKILGRGMSGRPLAVA